MADTITSERPLSVTFPREAFVTFTRDDREISVPVEAGKKTVRLDNVFRRMPFLTSIEAPAGSKVVTNGQIRADAADLLAIPDWVEPRSTGAKMIVETFGDVLRGQFFDQARFDSIVLELPDGVSEVTEIKLRGFNIVRSQEGMCTDWFA